MKCPKCGYNSFESHDSCIKCSSDLSAYKMAYGITPIVLPLEVRVKMSEEFRDASASDGHDAENNETHDDMFAFDLPEEPVSAAAPFNDNPFNFSDDPLDAPQYQTKREDDPFADLLETSPQLSNDPFAATITADAPQTSANVAASTSSPGQFDLDNFSWDDTPASESTFGKRNSADDFESLFGDMKESTKK